jgi:hypothetical protein
MDHLHAGRLEPVLPAAPLGGGDPEREEVQASLAVAPGARLGGRVRPLEREEPVAGAVAHREPDAAVAAALVAGPPPEERQPEHLAVEALAAVEIGALDREVVEGERHGGERNSDRRARSRVLVVAFPPVTLPLSRRRLLVAVEDTELAGLLAAAAARLGAEVTVARAGRAAVAALGDAHVAILDLPLSDLTPDEALAACARAGVPAVAITGVFRGGRGVEALRRLGAREVFEKPFPVEAVIAAAARLAGVVTTPVEEEAPDEVTGSQPLRGDDPGIIASPVPVLDEPPPAPAEPAPRDGFATPLPEGPRRASPAAARPGAPPPRGVLGATTVPRLLVALHVGQATGALTLAQGPVKKIVVVEKGVPVYAASNVAAERLGAICVRRGVVAAERLEALRRAAPAARTADLLLEAGLLAPARRAELVAAQIRAVAWSTFEWREGSYEFQLGRPPAARVPVAIGMGDLVLEGVLRTATLPRLRVELPADDHLAPAPDPAFELYALRLRPADARLLAIADGTKSVADLVRLSESPERDALAFLSACRVMRVLDAVDRVLASTRRIGFM